MTDYFKNKLIKLLDDETARFGRPIPPRELQTILSFGVWGELGENYFLFIYRDFYRDTPYYGAVIFLNHRDRLGRPVTILGVEQDGSEAVRNVYIKAAIFFLQNEGDATMVISGNTNIKMVFDMAREKINSYIGGERSVRDELKHFDYDIEGQKVECREEDVNPSRGAHTVEARLLKDLLDQLTGSPGPADRKAGTKSSAKSSAKSPAGSTGKTLLGIGLISRQMDLSGETLHFFQPLLIPLRTDGKPGKPQKPTLPLPADFQPDNPHPVLSEFLQHFTYAEAQSGPPKLKIDLLNQFFFHRLAETLLSLPDRLTFYLLPGGGKDYRPLKKTTFQKVEVRFAPALNKGSGYDYRCFLTFHGVGGEVFDAGADFDVMVIGGKAYCRFSGGDDKKDEKGKKDRKGDAHWFGVPEEPEHFHGLFEFLSVRREFSGADLPAVASALKKISSPFVVFRDEPLKKYRLHFLPTPVLRIFPADERQERSQRLELEFDYQTGLDQYIARHPDRRVCTHEPAKEFENHCLEVLKSDPLLTRQMDFNEDRKSVVHFYYFQDDDLSAWLLERGYRYLEKGFRLFSVKWKRFIRHTDGRIETEIKAGIDWLEFRPHVIDPFTGQKIEIDLLGSNPGENIVQDKKGMLHLVSKEQIDRLAEYYRHAEAHAHFFRVPSKNHVLLRRLYDKRMDNIPRLREVLDNEGRLKSFEKIPDYPLSKKFRGQLRTYQYEGFKWMHFMREYGFSGCLADDMGLGKTVQTLALLQTLKDAGELATSLLVVPVSAIPNWEAETRRFADGLTVHRHLGPARDRETAGWEKTDIIITSYGTMRNDIEMLKEFCFDYIILDESQNIKNLSSQVARAAKVLEGRNRLALSGTPIENNTLELWSLFDFLIPGFLGTRRWFSRQFAQAVEKGIRREYQDNSEHMDGVSAGGGHNDDITGVAAEKAHLLKKMIHPFVMRRKKAEVEAQLPEKIEIVTPLQMEGEQLQLYAETARYYREELDRVIEEQGVPGSSMRILEGMLRLRQICLLPGLVDEKHREVPSAKFDYFRELLGDILAENHKVLIFSQFVEVLKVLRGHCEEGGLVHSYIDGSVDVGTRERMVADFQENEENRVFLLSLKAGGVALNLTAADYVIIFDPWWNPAVEAQAIDRSHRIGQTRNVLVYRMVVKDSIEEKMLQLQERKKTLVDHLITSDAGAFKNLKKEDILDLFSL